MVDRQRISVDCLFAYDLGDVSIISTSLKFHDKRARADNNGRMSNRRSDLAEMTALYFIPIVSIVMAAATGGLVAGALTNDKYQLWTLVISYVFWGIGTPLSWIILAMYFIRMTVHKPLQREVIVSLLLPIAPLDLSGFSYVNQTTLSKLSVC